MFEESPNQYVKTMFPQLNNLYVDEGVNLYKDVDNNFSLSVISLQILEIVFSEKNPRMSQEFKTFLAHKLSQKTDLSALMESQAFKSIKGSLQMRLRASLGTDKLAENYLKNKEKLLANGEIDTNKKIKGSDMGELKVINKWKTVLRKLQPESKFMKEFIQAEFLLVLGNLNKSISYCQSAILEFTKVKQLDIMDWISLSTLLINCLLKVDIKDQAVYYAKNLIAYLGKAQREGLIPIYLAVLMVLGLESLYVVPKIDLITKAKQFKLPQPFLDSLQLYLLSPQTNASHEPGEEVMTILEDVK